MSKGVLTILIMVFLAGVLAVMTGGCGDDGGGVGVITHPSVRRTSPQDGAQDTNLNPLIIVWFDEELDEASIDSAAFHVVGASTYRLEYSNADSSVALYLASILEPESTYTVQLTTAIKNKNGYAMLSDFAFSFTTGTLDRDHLVDYLEPNDDEDSHAEIEVDKTYPALGSCGSGESDFYKFTLTEAAKVTLRIDHSFSELNETGWLMRFRRCPGQFYRSLFATLRDGETINLRRSFLPGTYCVETGNAENGVWLAVYDLTLETSAPCPDDEYEDNDWFWEAPYIAPGVHNLRGCIYDSDFFKVSLDSGQTLTAIVSQVPPGNDQRRLRIAGYGNDTLRQSTGTGDPMTLFWTADVDTTHHIEVEWFDDNIEYTLEFGITN